MPWRTFLSHRRRVLLVLCLVALAAGVLGWRLSASAPTEASGPPNPDIALHGAGVTCTTDNPGVSGKCTAEVGAIFTVSVDLLSIAGLPDVDGDGTVGYDNMNLRVTTSSGLPISNRPGTAEVVGPECGITAEFYSPFDYLAACNRGVGASEKTTLGTIFEVDVTCTAVGTEQFKLHHGQPQDSYVSSESNSPFVDKDPSPEVLTINCVPSVGTPTPTPLLTSAKAVAIEAGLEQTCAIQSAASVKCWGSVFGTTPADVPSLAGSAAISMGFGQICSVSSAGGAQCMGANGYGQLGDGTTTTRTAAVDVVGLGSGVVGIAAGGFHTCALTAASGVRCWGRNDDGQLGDGTTTSRTAPVDVVGLTSGVVQITAGGYHTCAVMAVGGLKCWGRNNFGQLGDGTTTDRPMSVDVAGLAANVMAVSGGENHTCALTAGGAAKCWGYNYFGWLGDGTTTTRTAPVDVAGLGSGVVAVAAGFQHSCALLASGGVKCWGRNDRGALGNGSMFDSSLPVDVVGLAEPASQVSAGFDYTCARLTDGQLQCWGWNQQGQLGAATGNQCGTACSTVAVSVPGFGQPPEPPPTPTPTPTPTPEFPFNLKLPALKNLFLTAQGTKLPPSTCAASTNSATFTHEIGYAPNSPDPKDPSQTQQVGGFEMNVLFDEDLICVNLSAGAYFTGTAGAVCFIDDKDQGLQPDGLARIGCVVKGKPATVSSSLELAVITVRPQPELYSLITADQENGVVVQVLNLGCNLADMQGHPIKKIGCDDSELTVRWLEGDVNGDCAVDVRDQQVLAFRWGAKVGALLYNDRFDLEPSGQINSDGDIDIKDVQFVYGRHGSTCAAPHLRQEPRNGKVSEPKRLPSARLSHQLDMLGPCESVSICGPVRLAF